MFSGMNTRKGKKGNAKAARGRAKGRNKNMPSSA